jgi:hypothetical protein
VYQYTVVVERPRQSPDQYFFQNFTKSEKVIETVSSMAEGLRVYKIFKLEVNGRVTELTVGFDNGRLNLIRKNNLIGPQNVYEK